jgi:hypothetical protein
MLTGLFLIFFRYIYLLGQSEIALNLIPMPIYLRLILYAVSFAVLFYNPFVAFVLLIGTHGLVWYFEKKGIAESQKNPSQK